MNGARIWAIIFIFGEKINPGEAVGGLLNDSLELAQIRWHDDLFIGLSVLHFKFVTTFLRWDATVLKRVSFTK